MAVGLITRRRTTVNGEENSVIDFLLFSSELLPLLKSVSVDEKRKYTLTRFGLEKGIKVVKESDHNLIVAHFEFVVQNVKKERKEIFICEMLSVSQNFKKLQV